MYASYDSDRDNCKLCKELQTPHQTLTFQTHGGLMKRLIPLLVLLPLSVVAHPNHEPSIHNEDLDLEDAHRRPPSKNEVTIELTPKERIITSNGIPDHDTGRFPNRNNPNAIQEQNYRFKMPLKPQVAQQPIKVGRQLFGVALNGVVFDPGTAEFYRNDRSSGWNYEALGGAVELGLDDHHAHVQPNGSYHYHGLPTGLFMKLSRGKRQMTLIGWAADGFPIYGLYGYRDPKDEDSGIINVRSSYRLKQGRRSGAGMPRGEYDGSFTDDYEYVPGLGDLDECNGRFGVTPEFPKGTYHYILTEDYPFIPRLFHGVPDESFNKSHDGGGRGPGGGGPGGGGPGGGGRPPFGPPPRR